MAKGKKKAATLFDEKGLSPAMARKLNATRKAMVKLLGDELGTAQADKAFADFLVQNPAGTSNGADKDAAMIAETLWPLVEKKKLHLTRGGAYGVRRGRGRLIVESLPAEVLKVWQEIQSD